MTDTTPQLPSPALVEASGRLALREGGRHQGDPDSPEPVDHEAAPYEERRPQALAALEAELVPLQALLASRGHDLWNRTVDWQRLRALAGEERGGGKGDAAPDDVVEERKGDAAAARYHDEVAALVRRMHDDAVRLQKIATFVLPAQPSKLKGKEMMAVQLTAEGLCWSCWRDDQAIVEIEVRTSGPSTGAPYYKGLCRFCGGWKGENGQVPPIDVVRRHHDGRNVMRKAG